MFFLKKIRMLISNWIQLHWRRNAGKKISVLWKDNKTLKYVYIIIFYSTYDQKTFWRLPLDIANNAKQPFNESRFYIGKAL